eukprot:COSAG01_NODE_2422_length_7726_cov_5.781172_10_plen_549_part_00
MEPAAAAEEAVPPPVASSAPDQMLRTLSARKAKEETAGGQLPTEIAVKFYVTGVGPLYMSPWKVQGQSKWTGTGFVLPGRMIMTNAHVVTHATVVQVQKQDIPKKFRARVQCIAHDLDLALVSVGDDGFWDGMPEGAFVEGLPELYSEVKAVGFPSGGATVCVTKGVLSRIDAQLYVHARSEGVVSETRNSPGNVLIYQIDAAINPGNSGGPTFDSAGKILGVSSSGMPGKQNVGYIIPSSIAQLFLSEVRATGSWSGVSELGLACRSLESDVMRDFLAMGEATGVLVEAIAPLGALCGVISAGDVLTQIDEYDVSNEGKVPIETSSQKVYVPADALISQKAKGASTTFTILRKGKIEKHTVQMQPIPPMMPRFHGVDSDAEYILFGGFIFTKSSTPLRREYNETSRSHAYRGPQMGKILLKGLQIYKSTPDREIVLLMRILEHECNIGYRDRAAIVKSVDGTEITNMMVLAETLAAVLKAEEEGAEGADKFVCFRFEHDDDEGEDERSDVPDLVLERAKIAEANAQICAQNRIAHVASERLRGPFLR